MTKEEIDERKQYLLATITVTEVLSRYGVQVKQRRCQGWCHGGKNLNMKVFRNGCHCFVCGKSYDIFDITMHFIGCDFWTAFELLGGTEKQSFATHRKARTATRKHNEEIAIIHKYKAELKRINAYITAYRRIIETEEPFSDLWCYAQNQLQLELYHLEYMTQQEER